MGMWQDAVADNARWCDLIARSHGLRTRSDQEAWTCEHRTPPFYPDAVTLTPGPAAPELLARIDVSPGCSVKDSFGDLDLRPHGFRVLFEADWIARPASQPLPAPEGLGWQRIVRPAELAQWEDAWRPDGGPHGLFPAAILGHDWVAVLAARHRDRIVAGAILTCGPAVAGVSNFFAGPGAGVRPLAGCLALAAELFPGRALAGYASDDELAEMLSYGFGRVGHLRVWANGTSPAA